MVSWDRIQYLLLHLLYFSLLSCILSDISFLLSLIRCILMSLFLSIITCRQKSQGALIRWKDTKLELYTVGLTFFMHLLGRHVLIQQKAMIHRKKLKESGILSIGIFGITSFFSFLEETTQRIHFFLLIISYTQVLSEITFFGIPSRLSMVTDYTEIKIIIMDKKVKSPCRTL